MNHERFEICVESVYEDDYVVAVTCTDPLEAVDYLVRLNKCGLQVAIRVYSWFEEIKEGDLMND